MCVFYFTDLLIFCQAAETLTDQPTDLAQTVTINCDFDVQEVNWLLLKLPDSPVLILLSSTTSATFYYNKTFKHKYSVQSKHRLFINNATLDDLGLYYCVTTDAPPKYSSGTRLYITVVKIIDQNHWQIISLISALLNGVLIIVIIGLVKVFVLGSKRTRDNLKHSQDTHLQQPQATDLEQPQNSSQAQEATRAELMTTRVELMELKTSKVEQALLRITSGQLMVQGTTKIALAEQMSTKVEQIRTGRQFIGELWGHYMAGKEFRDGIFGCDRTGEELRDSFIGRDRESRDSETASLAETNKQRVQGRPPWPRQGKQSVQEGFQRSKQIHGLKRPLKWIYGMEQAPEWTYGLE
ncbi:uncharacterized protein LOC107676348 [Sinocyclocheilus anshuiensis]|uniref:uncharacterized protein LOC107676348 n=1 Tax=Sinocyclocheilus anshuiensis TaxID=1608454 RepID=UPI0007B93E1D|nr:PREDICTED: uncharacterized protein LOC107676348 [Sinocyclocheilus anshuiensis]